MPISNKIKVTSVFFQLWVKLKRLKRQQMRTKESAKRHEARDFSGRFRRFKPRQRPAAPECESHSDGNESDRIERIEADQGSSSAQGNKGEAAAVTEEMD